MARIWESQGTRLMPKMVRKLSFGFWRRGSKASRDGSLSENIAKADIRTSSKGISTSPDRGSGIEVKMEWRSRKRTSAEGCLRAFLAAAIMGNSVCLRVKRGKPGNYSADWLYEREGETELQIPKKMSEREPLISDRPSRIPPKSVCMTYAVAL